MGTWGTHPFDDDLALDLCAGFGELGEREKAERFRDLFSEAIDPQGKLIRSMDVVAGAALVALALPGGHAVVACYLDDEPDDEEDEWISAMPSAPPPQLVSLALDALQSVTAPGSEWQLSWVRDGDLDEALGHVQTITTVLRSAAPVA